MIWTPFTSFPEMMLRSRESDTPLPSVPMMLPDAGNLEPRLLLGSLLFGVGWGLAGFCPGPALVALGAGYAKAAVFTAAMLAGMWVFEWTERLLTRSAPAAEPHAANE